MQIQLRGMFQYGQCILLLHDKPVSCSPIFILNGEWIKVNRKFEILARKMKYTFCIIIIINHCKNSRNLSLKGLQSKCESNTNFVILRIKIDCEI